MNNKDIAIVHLTLKNELVYRTNAIIKIIYSVFPMVFTLFLWNYLYRYNAVIGRYNKNDMYIYYMLSYFIYNTLNAGLNEFTYANEIKNGTIIRYMIRPYEVVRYMFFASIKDVLFFWIIMIIPASFVFHIYLNTVSLKIWELIIVLFALIGGYLISFFMKMIVIAMAFFLDSISCLPKAINTIKHFVAGGLIPLDLFPTLLFEILSLTPFKYLGYFQVVMIMNKLDYCEIFKNLFVEIFWVVILWYMNKAIWQKGLNKYTAFGG